MKIFEYNPTTGKRGKLIDDVRRISWTDQSISNAVEHGQIEPIDFALPKSSKNSEWKAHVDAGITASDGSEISYRRDQWICFCSGEWRVGQGEGIWQWHVIPPLGAVKHKHVA